MFFPKISMSAWKTHDHVMKTHCVITLRVHTDASAWKVIAMSQRFLEKSVMISMSAMKVYSFISWNLLYFSDKTQKGNKVKVLTGRSRNYFQRIS